MGDTLIQVAMAAVLLFVMFSMGLVLTWADFKRVALMPLTVLLGLIAEVALVPLMAFGATWALNLPLPVALGIMLVSICPSGPVCNFLAHISGGDLALSLTLTATVTALSLVSLPGLFNWTLLSSHAGGVAVPTLVIIQTLIGGIIVPTAIGMGVRARWPAFAEKVEKNTEKIGSLLILFVVSMMFIKNRAVFGDIGGLLLAVVLLVNVGGMIAGYLWAGLFRRGRVVGKTFAFEIGVQNIPLATTLGYGLFAADQAQLSVILSVIILYGVMSLVTALGAVFIFNKFLPSRPVAVQA